MKLDGLRKQFEKENYEYDSLIDKLNTYSVWLEKKVIASEKLCEIYFNIASEISGEEEVRAKRDEIITGIVK